MRWGRRGRAYINAPYHPATSLPACSENVFFYVRLSIPQWLETADDVCICERVAEVPMEQSAAAVRVMLRFVYAGEEV